MTNMILAKGRYDRETALQYELQDGRSATPNPHVLIPFARVLLVFCLLLITSFLQLRLFYHLPSVDPSGLLGGAAGAAAGKVAVPWTTVETVDTGRAVVGCLPGFQSIGMRLA